MVLADLGTKITGALHNIFNSPIIDEEAIDKMLKEIAVALLSSDVNVQLVKDLRANIKAQLNFEEIPSGLNKRKLIEKAVITELCKLLDPGTQPYKPQKGKTNVIMFVGLQGSGKTTTITKLGYHYKKKGWKVCIVCADTFRAGAFDQLSQNAHKVKIPYYGSHSERDPVKLAQDGVEAFKKDGFELILVDTSGRHKQEKELFDEMAQISAVVKPDDIVFIMDASIGQAAFDQALAFKQTVAVGSVIITKLDGHAKGGGALSAVAATKSPIIFLGTGEHFENLEPFDAKSFVGKLLGFGDLKQVFDKFNEVITKDKQKEMAKKISTGNFSLRDMYEQLQAIMQMGPISQIMDLIPGLGQFLNQIPNAKNVDVSVKFKSYMVIMDSMTDTELDDPKIFTQKTTRDSRVIRVARGSGRSIREVNELLDQYKYFGDMIKKFGDMRLFGKDGNINIRNLMNNPGMKNMPIGRMGNMGMGLNMQNLLKMASQAGLGGKGGLGGLGGLGAMFGGKK
jgi:signal recognition particle subunit SRP54